MLSIHNLRNKHDLGAFALGIIFGLGFAYLHQNGSLANLSVSTDEFLSSNLTSKNESGSVKLLCWILAGPKNHWRKAVHVRETWGKKCDKLLFLSNLADSNLPSKGLKDVEEGYKFLWGKTKAAFKYVYYNHLHEFDWFLKGSPAYFALADDDTFVVVDNLKALLKGHNPNDPIWFGRENTGAFSTNYFFSWMAGGAGYVLSKEAVRRFVELGLAANATKECYDGHEGPEDYLLGQCITKLGVEARDSRNRAGRHRFSQTPLHHHLRQEYMEYGAKNKMTKEYSETSSDKPISFHYVWRSDFYVFDYLFNYVDSGVPAGNKNK